MAIPITQMLSNWGNLFPFFNMSTDKFYAKLEEVIKSHQIPDTKIERVNLKEGGFLSASREYLRVKYHNLVFDICAAPFGKDFFVSWWLYETESAMKSLMKLTKATEFLSERAARQTFFEADQESMFRSCVHKCVLEVIDSMLSDTGSRLSEMERQIHVSRA
ncbi:hypothetical protein [Limnovirga soli]|uniref:Uncharacterized protein n=1 Tax=Limnovirga soli TaxID=2656915 RepID=A0A8J8F997_9BACT|nr:hypothetical protein [Limnovirga soli]NNV53865.1 hypothetical protein [Limnovirga soli]